MTKEEEAFTEHEKATRIRLEEVPNCSLPHFFFIFIVAF
jgi:hypothetical protein